MFKKQKNIEFLENGFNYKNQFYKYEIVKNIFFTIINTVQKVNFVKQGEAKSSQIFVTLDSGKTINLKIDEASILFALNFDKKKEIKSLFEVYQVLASLTHQIRKNKYLSELKTYRFFTYEKCKFYPQEKKIIFRKKELDLEKYNLLKSKGFVEIRKKEFKALDRLKRELSFGKIPQFNTQTDADIIFELLKDYFGIIWEK